MDALRRCPRCWKHTPSGAQFCPRCGAALQAAAAVVQMPPQRRPASSGGLTAMLLFLVIGAFGLMITLFVTTTTHAPMILPPSPSAEPVPPAPPQDGVASDDGSGTPIYVPRWDDNGHYRVPPPPVQPMYPVRPRVVYPPDHDPHHQRDEQPQR